MLLCILRLVPTKLLRDWMELFVAGKPLYDEHDELTEAGIQSDEQMLPDIRHQVLADNDFVEYRVSSVLDTSVHVTNSCLHTE